MTNEMTTDERIAALRVLKKQIDEALKDAEAEVKYAFVSAERPIKTLPLMVAGREVGQATFVPGKPVAQIIPGREAEALAFLKEHGLTEEQPAKGWQQAFAEVAGAAVHAETGELCGAIEFMPSKAPYVRYSGFKRADVLEAFQARGIEAADVLRLTGGNDDQ